MIDWCLFDCPASIVVMADFAKNNIHLGDLETLVCEMPQRMQLSSGRFAILEKALTDEHKHHYVIFFPKELGSPTEQDRRSLLEVAVDIARMLAEDTYGDPECYSVTMNGSRTGSWNDVMHVNIYIFQSREEKIESYRRAINCALGIEDSQDDNPTDEFITPAE